MKVSNNHKLIKRGLKGSQAALFLSLAVLAISLVWSINNVNTSKIGITFLILIPGYLLVQLSIYMVNHWGRSPRPYETIVSALKGLNNQFYLYNHNAGVPHLLVCPAGIWIIKPYYHEGQISYNVNKKRYEQIGGPKLIGRIFSQESLPNIERESKALLNKYHKFMAANNINPPVEPQFANFFYSEEALVNSENAPELIIQADKFKEFLRLEARKVVLSDEDITQIIEQLPKEFD